jgi:CheY-like chemotaxis protein
MAARCSHTTEPRFRLLYVGNDLHFIAALRKALMVVDYQLVSCGHSEHAIMFLKSEIPYNFLLIDLDWQGTEGLKLAQIARSLRHRKRMPIMVVAGSELNSETKTLADGAGVKKCLTKTPVEAVSEAIRQMTPR